MVVKHTLVQFYEWASVWAHLGNCFGKYPMSSTVHQPPLKMTATMAATVTNCMAVALRERFAAIVSFQRHQPSFPPTQDVTSATCSLISAGQFSGKCAISAANAVIAAITATKGSPLGQHLV
jgi:hypothetical protein